MISSWDEEPPQTTLWHHKSHIRHLTHALKYLQRKNPGPQWHFSNDILKILPPTSTICYSYFSCNVIIKKPYPKNGTIVPYTTPKIDSPTGITNYKPIALAGTIYKLFTNNVTSLLTIFGKQHKIFHHNQKVFRPMRNTVRQIQTIIAALENNKFTNNDIHITYIDFKSAFSSIDHPRLLVIMEDLDYPLDTIKLIGTTSFCGAHFTTHPQ